MASRLMEALKKLGGKCCAAGTDVHGDNVDGLIECIAEHYAGGGGGGIARHIEKHTVSTWTADAAISPFAYKATVLLTNAVGANTVIEISLDAIVAATTGIVIGGVSGQVATLYAKEKPTAPAEITFILEG